MSNIFYEDKIIANIIFKGQVLEDGYRFIEISYCERELDEDGNPVKNENGDDMAKVERYIKNEEGKEVPEVLLLTEIRPYREDCTHPEIRHLVDEKGWTKERIQTQTNLEIRRASEEWQIHNKEFLDGAKQQIREEYNLPSVIEGKKIYIRKNFDAILEQARKGNFITKREVQLLAKCSPKFFTHFLATNQSYADKYALAIMEWEESVYNPTHKVCVSCNQSKAVDDYYKTESDGTRDGTQEDVKFVLRKLLKIIMK